MNASGNQKPRKPDRYPIGSRMFLNASAKNVHIPCILVGTEIQIVDDPADPATWPNRYIITDVFGNSWFCHHEHLDPVPLSLEALFNDSL